MKADWTATIVRPTLVLDEAKARHNIERMAAKAQRHGVKFRPHFKTHQSATIGEWFREVGVHAITVSSVRMAVYFAAHGWTDITIAFPANLREIATINQLAAQARLHLLVDSVETVDFLDAHLSAPVGVWIEADTGYGRSGVRWDDGSTLYAVASAAQRSEKMALQGLLAHDGGTYALRSATDIRARYGLAMTRLERMRNWLMEYGFLRLELSVGDTPACSVLDELPGADELRPGNFVFYDWTQVQVGSCAFDDVAVVAACPVVGKYPDRHEVVLYGGAVHLSKDFLTRSDGTLEFGRVALFTESGWGAPIEGAWLRSLSQEHGIVQAEPAAYDEVLGRLQVGDLLAVVPIHSCLTADLLKHYVTLDGCPIEMMI